MREMLAVFGMRAPCAATNHDPRGEPISQPKNLGNITIIPDTSPAILMTMVIATRPASRKSQVSTTIILAINLATWTITDTATRAAAIAKGAEEGEVRFSLLFSLHV